MMKVEFDIPDEILQTTVKEAVMRQVQQIVDIQVRSQMAKHQSAIVEAVEVVLAKRYTDLQLKNLIDKALIERIKDLDL